MHKAWSSIEKQRYFFSMLCWGMRVGWVECRLWQCHSCQILCGLGKVEETLACPNHRHLSPRIRGKVYEACVPSTMLHGMETWGPKEPELRRLPRNDRTMIHWICRIKGRDKTPSLLQKLSIKYITSVLRCRRLRWYGHVQLGVPCIKSITNFLFSTLERKEDLRRHGVKTGGDMCGLGGVDPWDRDAWRAGVQHSLVCIVLISAQKIVLVNTSVQWCELLLFTPHAPTLCIDRTRNWLLLCLRVSYSQRCQVITDTMLNTKLDIVYNQFRLRMDKPIRFLINSVFGTWFSLLSLHNIHKSTKLQHHIFSWPK